MSYSPLVSFGRAGFSTAKRIYVASSWRNDRQPELVAKLRALGFRVYDYRHPAPDDDGFNWKEIDGGWQQWTPEQFVAALQHPIALRGFAFDMNALRLADAVVMVQPCGRSAALELGWACGAGKPTAVLLAPDQEPELMLKMADFIALDDGELYEWLERSL